MKHVALMGLGLLLVGTVSGCDNATARGTGADKLVITGSSTVAPLVADMAKRFEQAHPGVRVDVQSGGSSRGIADARKGLAHVGMVSRSLKDDESDLYSFTIAIDGVCMIVHASNPIGSLTSRQVVEVYTGEITNWRQLGGPDRPITVVHKAQGRSTLELFLEHFSIHNERVKPSVVIGDNQQGIKTVSGNPYAIGYVSVGSAEYEATHGTPIKLLPMNGVEATVASVAAGSFPLCRQLNLVTPEPSSGLTQRFVDFAQSLAMHDLIAEHSFVPIVHE